MPTALLYPVASHRHTLLKGPGEVKELNSEGIGKVKKAD